jgi:periplasmic protein TonB
MRAPSQDLRPIPQVTAKSSRAVSLTLVAVLHVAIIYALASGLAHQMVELLPQNVQVNIIPPQETKNEPPPPPPTFKQPPPFVPPPDVNIDLSQAPATTAITAQSTQKLVDSAPVPSRRNTISANDYPPLSVKLSEEGTVLVKVLIMPDGSVGDVQLAKSSGFQRLDDKTLDIIKNRWHYSPPTREGKPTQVWWNVRVKWQLKEFGLAR